MRMAHQTFFCRLACSLPHFFHRCLQIQTEKLTLLLKKLFLMSISMKNRKKPEKQHPASGNVLQEAGGSAAGSWQGTRRAVPQPVLPAGQPAWSLWEGADGTTLTVQHEEMKQDKISK